MDKCQSTEGVTSHTEEFHIYSIGIEGRMYSYFHFRNITLVTVEWKRGCGVRTYFYNLGEKLNVFGPT